MKNKTISLIKFFLGWPISLLALIFLWRLFAPNLSDIFQKILHANILFLLFSLLLFQIYFLCRSLLWKKILEIKGHKIPLQNTVWYWSIAELNRYIPGNIWSIVGRGLAFTKFGVSKSTVLIAWIEESMLILLGSALVALMALPFIWKNIVPDFPLKNIGFWAVPIISLCIIFAWIFQKRLLLIKKIQSLKIFSLDRSFAFQLLFLAIVTFIIFGAGTYFAILAIFPLPLGNLDLFIGLFSFSFTVGYLSFITPMGLGIRELVMSKGLMPFLSIANAGFASLFARFFLIFSELVFLCFAYIISEKLVKKQIILSVKKYIYEYFLGISIAVYIIYFTTVSFLRYTNFFTGRFDLGNMDQTVWNSLHGKIFMLTDPNGTNVMSRLGTHADFILVLLAPFYLIWEDPRMLLLLQTLILATGALFVYLIAKNIIKNKSLGFVLALCYLLNPSIQYTNLYDFHAVTFATTFFLASWYFLIKKKYLWMTLFLVLAGITKEEAWLVVGMMGTYVFIAEKKKMLGSLLSIGSLAMFYFLIWKFIPIARGGQHFALSYYSDFGSTPTGVIKNILFSPQKIAALLFNAKRFIYIFELISPLSFLSLFAPQLLIFVLPELGINLLSANTQMQEIAYQYTAVITPFIFIASVYGIYFLTQKYKRISLYMVSIFLLTCTILSAYFLGPLPGASHPDIDVFTRQETDRSIIQGFLQDIPSEFSVAATNNLGSHLSHRQNIFTIPVGIDKADVVAFLLNDQFAQPSLAVQKQLAEQMKHDKNYIEVFKENDFIVFEKRNLYTRPEPAIEKGKLYPAAIETLQHRDFEGGKITITNVLVKTNTYTSVLFSYPSDGLTLYGRADIPNTLNSQDKFPVVIINRGYLQSSVFQEATSYINISETFAQNGFMAITPNYRNNGESDKDRSIVGILGYPIDVLNLINSLPHFPQADNKHVFLWGFSVGGQVTLSTLAVYDQNKNITSTIQAASVWNSVVDPYSAYTQFHFLFPNERVPYQFVNQSFGAFTTNPVAWESVSPLYYLNDITTPVRIADAYQDEITPTQWSIELYEDLKYYHNNATFSLYNTNHNFTNTWRQVVEGDINYFRSFIR